MKSAKYIASVLFFYLLAITCSGQIEKVTVETGMGSGIFKLLYKTTTGPGPVKISILDGKDQTIFTETIKTASFSRPYNLNELGTGDFKIVVEDKDGKTEKKVSYAIAKVESLIDVSKIGNSKNKYLLTIENKDSDHIQVKILDTDNTVLHEESITVNGKFAVVYNMDKVKTTPKFEVSGSSGSVKTFTF